jgi:hypothetical protein
MKRDEMKEKLSEARDLMVKVLYTGFQGDLLDAGFTTDDANLRVSPSTVCKYNN